MRYDGDRDGDLDGDRDDACVISFSSTVLATARDAPEYSALSDRMKTGRMVLKPSRDRRLVVSAVTGEKLLFESGGVVASTTTVGRTSYGDGSRLTLRSDVAVVVVAAASLGFIAGHVLQHIHARELSYACSI